VFKLDPGPCHDWLGSALTTVCPEGVRIAKPVPAVGGAWRHEGWSATEWVEGVRPEDARPTVWLDIIDAGRAFHRAVAHLPRPPCLDRRSDPWATADQAAWGERAMPLPGALTEVALKLREALEPLGPPQLVHGDLTGNILFAQDQPPAVIDLSPYWRPPAYAEGVVIADALCWHGASPSLLPTAGVSVTAVARGLLFRLLATGERVVRKEVPATSLLEEADHYDEAACAIGL
jgi:Phosphotransferase enzyme family